jgi:predicted membrane protein
VPDWGQIDWFSLGLSILAAFALLRMKFGILTTLALCGAIGAVWKLAV